MITLDIFSKKFVVAVAMTSLIGGVLGCSVATPPALIEARNSYQRAEKDPNMTGNAAVALRDAQQVLNRGERDWEQNRDREEAEHLAYLASQRVEIARRIAERNVAEKDFERLSEERQRLIIETREREALRSRKEAEARTEEAERARREALAAQAQAMKAQKEAKAQARQAELARKSAVRSQEDAEAARKQAEEAAAKNKELEQSLQALQAKVKQTDRGLVLTLGDVLFEFNKSELKAGALRNLYPLVSFLKQNSSRGVTIEGHTDGIGAESYNLQLSQRRAEAVRNFLVENGIAQDRVTARGLGEGYPVASNNTEPGRQINRRVEIVIANEKQARETGK
jgi:outer membrane protein OmpA-like peptidoglycan-associated protein